MTADYRLSLVRSFERHPRAENRSEHIIASYLESLRQAEVTYQRLGRSASFERSSIHRPVGAKRSGGGALACRPPRR